MAGFADVQAALDRAIGPADIGFHRAFWRVLTRDQFVAKKVYNYPLVVVGDATSSNKVRALRGHLPFGDDTGTVGASMPRMPARMPAMPEADIELIEQWINQGCPA